MLATRLHPFDLALVAIYLVGITLFGLRFRSKDKSLQNYFLAGRTTPWWAIALSIVSAETSTLTIIGIPALSFAGDFGFLQIAIGYLIGRIVICIIFLPRYFEGTLLTAYQLIDRRFGAVLHKITAALFLLTRAAAEGVRVYAISIVVSLAIGVGDITSIAIISALTLLYTFEGGMAAVIWTDVVQMLLYIAGTLVALFTLSTHVPGGWSAIHTIAGASGHFHLFDFTISITKSYTFWAGILGGTFLTMASHGTDQLIVQRLLATKNLRESRAALLGSGVVIFVQFTLFLLIGAGLFVFYGQHPQNFTNGNRIFPTFIVQEMPTGVAGLLIAAILAAAMSNLSAALNSLSSTTVVDFYLRMKRKKVSITDLQSDRQGFEGDGLQPVHNSAAKNGALAPEGEDAEMSRDKVLASRISTLAWALVLFSIAVYSILAGGKGNVVELGLSIASVAYGSLLGVFLLGTLTRYATQTGAIIGMIFGFALNLILWLQSIHLMPNPLFGIHFPAVAFTWYVILGAAVTFILGSIISFIKPNKTSAKRTAATIASALILALCVQTTSAQNPTNIVIPSKARNLLLPRAQHAIAQSATAREASHPPSAQDYDFSAIDTLMAEATAQNHPDGAVIIVGHNGSVVFKKAYGNRAIDPKIEPMTEDTIFDMASLTKCLATATAIMQLYEQGKFQLDDPVAKYLPDFANHGKENITIRQILTHHSGLAPDVSLKAPWGLAAPDRAEGIRLAMQSVPRGPAGKNFVYSDINYIVAGLLVEKFSRQREDDYVAEHIYKPLGMTHTRYLPFDLACQNDDRLGAAVIYKQGIMHRSCPPHHWDASLINNIAPTTHDDEGNAQINPHFDMITRGTVHDPTTRRMGGVAGHAGLFSTADDVAIYAQALLDRLAGRPSKFPLKTETLRIMCEPQQPAGSHNLRGIGWDIDTAFSKPRGTVFPVGSFGHTGFTGTTLWMDPRSDSYYVLLSNAVHPRGGKAITPLRAAVATAAAKAMYLYTDNVSKSTDVCNFNQPSQLAGCFEVNAHKVISGIDVLESTNFQQLANKKLGLLTNGTGLDSRGKRTIDILHHAGHGIQLVRLFSPEHGITGKEDHENIHGETDPASGLPVISLYAPKLEDRKPKHEQLKDLDAVVFDLQDAGVRFYTYETVLGYFLEAVSAENKLGHHLEFIVLDRPALTSGVQVTGPMLDPGKESYTAYMPEPIQHGMTLGELARFINGEKHLDVPLTVIQMQNWQRGLWYDETGIPWVNPSPNLVSNDAAALYPGVELLQFSNVSVGRGTPTPFLHFGAPWIDEAGAQKLADTLNARDIPGVTFEPISFTPAEKPYMYAGQLCHGIRILITDRARIDAPTLGIELLSAVHKQFPTEAKLDRTIKLVGNQATFDAILAGEDPKKIVASWQDDLFTYRERRQKYLLYGFLPPAR
ncbi:MAG: sodium/solute symporter [Acidobacteria bacterium]|nr:sodium/solute symporter [Acidobacteriota bacterium]